MGAKESKASCISYEEAIKRVSDHEFRRIKEAFKRSSGPGRTHLSQSAFQQDVLCEGVPLFVAELLYTACGGTLKGISFKELFCGLILLTRGSEDEKIRFLWNLYCNESGTYILKSDYTKALSLHSPETSDLQGFNHSNAVTLFSQSDRVNFEQFHEWIIRNKTSTVLAKWILSETAISLTSELETPTFYQSLAGVTHLEEKDIGCLEKEFWKLKNSSVNGQLDLNLLGPLISPPIPISALAGLFSAFDENRDGHIDFKELCCGVSAACRGPNVERCKFCFKVFDIDRDGVLNYEEMKQMIDILIFVAKENRNANNYTSITKNHVINDLLRFTRKSVANGDAVKQLSLTDNEQLDQSFSLTQEDFMMWSVESSLNLVQPFLDLTFEVCHIVFGLTPQCKHMENDIVRGWLTREGKRGYTVGQFWYLISKEWWISWNQYTQHYSITPCMYCKISSSNRHTSTGVDEAMICDESFNSTESNGDGHTMADSSSLGSGSSGISYGRQSYSKPGPIDNTNLVTPNIYKNIRTLTGEGGHLKKDTPLVQSHDFELVPKSLWVALSRWYGDILPLPRQVIQPPNNPSVELELYPLNIRILLHQNQNQPNNNPQAVTNWSGVSGGALGSYAALSTVQTSLQPPKRYLAHLAAFSRLATIKQIGEFLCVQLKLKPEDIRLWHIFSSTISAAEDVPVLLEEENMTLQELEIKDADQILVEIRNKDLTWPEELGALSLSQKSFQDRRNTRASIQSVHALGATGLHNLGNTCFMNSALQVLFNTQALTQYFRKSMHLFELNTTNKLGTKGQLATRYGELLKEIWTATTRSVAPLKLRFCVTKFASQFAGGGQHDSQELLEWLLDALHEDLNRVTEKPYTELKDSDGRPDEIVAAEAWSLHHSRNQSIVIDLFYGQLKSKVSCLCCGRESVRFDPFSLLSLPLPVENYTYFEILVILLDGSIPIKYGLRMNSDAKYSDLKKNLSALCSLNPNFMLVCEISNSQIKYILYDELKLKPSNATELYVYQLPEDNSATHSRTSSILAVNIEKGLKDIQRSSALLVGSDTIPFHHNQQPHIQLNSIQSNHSVCSKVIEDEIEIESDGNVEKRTSKQTVEISTSPDSTFVPNSSQRKRVSTANLLNENTQSGNNSSDEVSIEKTPCDRDALENFTHTMRSDCPCRSTCDSCDDDDSSSLNLEANMFSRGPSFNYAHKVGRYLVAIHRKITRQDTYFLSYHKTRPSLFGVPLLIPCCDSGTNKDLYCAVWLQVNRLLSPLPPTPDQSNHAADCDDSLGYDFPFTLRAVTADGMTCALCPWSNFCRGCEIPCNDDILLHGALLYTSSNTSNSSTPKLSTRFSSLPNLDINRYKTKNSINFGAINIAIDWDPTALHLRYQITRERLWTEHESVAVCRREQTEPVDLHHCLRAFTSEEKLEQWYHCSHCKGKKPATKKLQIWKLPPILIIHLKRFNCVNNKWVKSQKAVHFPFDNFDPTAYLASVPQETILRHADLQTRNSMSLCNGICPETEAINESKETTYDELDNAVASRKDQQIIPDTNVIKVENSSTNDNERKLLNRNVSPANSDTATMRTEKRRRLISTSLTKTPVIDGEFKDYHSHKLKPGVDHLDLKYKLYAVVSHSGMLSGGHYISYAANPNGSWYCYNDSSCREIPTRPNIDPASAYLLFYERQGLDYEPYLPNVEGRTIPNGNAMEIDENENDLKKMCVLS